MTTALLICIGLIVYSVLGVWMTGRGTKRLIKFLADLRRKKTKPSKYYAWERPSYY